MKLGWDIFTAGYGIKKSLGKLWGSESILLFVKLGTLYGQGTRMPILT